MCCSTMDIGARVMTKQYMLTACFACCYSNHVGVVSVRTAGLRLQHEQLLL